jgi:hypothetical protein
VEKNYFPEIRVAERQDHNEISLLAEISHWGIDAKAVAR